MSPGPAPRRAPRSRVRWGGPHPGFESAVRRGGDESDKALAASAALSLSATAAARLAGLARESRLRTILPKRLHNTRLVWTPTTQPLGPRRALDDASGHTCLAINADAAAEARLRAETLLLPVLLAAAGEAGAVAAPPPLHSGCCRRRRFPARHCISPSGSDSAYCM